MAPHLMQMPVSVITILHDRPSGALAHTFRVVLGHSAEGLSGQLLTVILTPAGLNALPPAPKASDNKM